jgi:hypothetical protein
MASSGTQAGNDGAIRGQVLGQIRLCLGNHEPRQTAVRIPIIGPSKLVRAPPTVEDGELLEGEGEGRGVA